MYIYLAIRDCTGYLFKAGKKDALFIADVFNGLLLDFDAEKNCVDLFYFDSASNVQKAGTLLEVRFPRTVPYHGDEHVVALWFFRYFKDTGDRVFFVSVFQLLYSRL